MRMHGSNDQCPQMRPDPLFCDDRVRRSIVVSGNVYPSIVFHIPRSPGRFRKYTLTKTDLRLGDANFRYEVVEHALAFALLLVWGPIGVHYLRPDR